MSTDALLTVLGLLVAIAALLPRERLLNLRLRIRPLDVGVFVAALLVVHYIKYFPVLNALGVPDLGPWRWGFDPDNASYLVMVVAAGFIYFRVRWATLEPGRIPTFQNLAETYLFSERFPELLFLLERNLADLRRFIEHKHLATRLRKWITPPTMIRLLHGPPVNIDGSKPSTSRLLRLLPTTWRRVLARVLPNYDGPTRQAERVFERVFLSAPFVEYLAKARPYFGLEVLSVDQPFFREPFLKMYVIALLGNADSILYEEIRQNQSFGQHGRYVIDPLNPLLSFFFAETFRADELNLYKPVGDAILERLEFLGRNQSSDRYRQPTRDYVEDERWRCPIFAGRCLFDFMITEGLHRGVHWHMWLMYFEYWTERIVRNMSALGPDVDLSREFPTPYHYLLYELFTTQREWIRVSAEVDQTLESVLVESVDLEYDSIAKSAAISLGGCFRTVVESIHITPRFKGYLLGVVAYGYAQVVERRRDVLGQMYAKAMLEGGTQYRDLSQFRLGLAQALPCVDRDSLYMSPGADLIKMLQAIAE